MAVILSKKTQAFRDEFIHQNLKQGMYAGGFEQSIEDRKDCPLEDLSDLETDCTVGCITAGGYNTFSLCMNDDYDKVIFDIHGGAYLMDINSDVIMTAEYLAKNANAKVYLPIYPLMPHVTCPDVLEYLVAAYQAVLEEGKEIIVMGDSAGGNLSAVMALHLKKLGIRVPDKLILISPVVINCSDNPEMLKLDSEDVLLACYGINKMGELWKGELDAKDYRVSPYYGDLENFPKSLIFTGTKEILYPDILLFADKLEKTGCDIQLVVKEDLFHDFAVAPVPEGDEAREMMKAFIQA